MGDYVENGTSGAYNDVVDLLQSVDPHEPVYCIYPKIYEDSTKQFLGRFPGRVLYAVKANNDPQIVTLLHHAGVRHFDCASLEEIRLVAEHCPASTIYFMNPVRFEGHAKVATHEFGVRHFVVDHADGVAALAAEIDPATSIVFGRMAVSHASAAEDLSFKFGAPPEDIPAMLSAIAKTGAEPALAFNVGSGVTSPEAYAYALRVATDVLSGLPFRIRLLDIGGGFARSYPGYAAPSFDDYFDAIRVAAKNLALADDGELLAEPGRALSAPGLSVVTRVLLKKPDRVYLNDGMYGAFWELRFKGHKTYPSRVFRDGRPLDGKACPFSVFGPTCDSSDVLPATVELPESIAVGDHIEFGSIGAYSLSGRTNFNGFYNDHVVQLTGQGAMPPTGAASVNKKASN